MSNNILDGVQEQQMVLVPMALPMITFRFLNEVAIKEGKTVATLVNEALREKVDKLADKHLSEGGRNGQG
jgi:hypothetical protein